MQKLLEDLYEFIVFLQATASAYILVQSGDVIVRCLSILSFIVLSVSLTRHYLK